MVGEGAMQARLMLILNRLRWGYSVSFSLFTLIRPG